LEGVFLWWQWNITDYTPTKAAKSRIYLMENNSKLHIDFLQPINTADGTIITIEDTESSEIGQDVLNALNVHYLSFNSGNYSINFSSTLTAYGSVDIPVTTN
jgi:hypothetical protein